MRRRMCWRCFKNSEKKRSRWSIYMDNCVLRLRNTQYVIGQDS